MELTNAYADSSQRKAPTWDRKKRIIIFCPRMTTRWQTREYTAVTENYTCVSFSFPFLLVRRSGSRRTLRRRGTIKRILFAPQVKSKLFFFGPIMTTRCIGSEFRGRGRGIDSNIQHPQCFQGFPSISFRSFFSWYLWRIYERIHKVFFGNIHKQIFQGRGTRSRSPELATEDF